MIPIYICDDEKNILDYLEKQINNTITIYNYPMTIKACVTTPSELLEMQKQDVRGIYFLDVNLKDDTYNGFELAIAIRQKDPRAYIIFITTHAQLALETFKYKIEAMDYIDKDDLSQLDARIRQCLTKVLENILFEKNDKRAYYTIKVFDEIHSIPIHSILYFETSTKKHRVLIHTDELILEYFDTLKQIEEQIGCDFIRTHRSFLVNKNRVRSLKVSQGVIQLDNGEVCLIAKKAIPHLKKEIF